MPRSQAYVQGRFSDADDAAVPVLDRGLLFGDAVYEVVRFIGGRGFAIDQHVERLTRSLAAVGIPATPQVAKLPAITAQMLARGAIQDATVYWQVTRGVMRRRAHDWSDDIEPTVIALADPADPLMPDRPIKQGSAELVADRRWADPWIKTTMLLPNTMARHRAHQAGHIEALLVRDHAIVEGTSTNVMAVNAHGELITPPMRGQILPGVTRQWLLDHARTIGITVRQQSLPLGDLAGWRELMICGTTTLVAAITSVVSSGDEDSQGVDQDTSAVGPDLHQASEDSQVVGDGEVGPVTRTLYEALLSKMRTS